MRIIKLNEENKKNILSDLLKRDPNQYDEYADRVAVILKEVKANRDAAVLAFTKKFDGADLTADQMLVTKEEIDEALATVDPELIGVMKRSASNICEFHTKQLRYSWFDTKEDGSLLGQRVTPIGRVGIYVPGGTAPLSSTVLMNVIPAKVAGVPEIIMTTPPGKDGKVNPVILAAATIAGADKIYKVGGAQAIAAMAYGTETIPKVDKIAGPGNIYVALAKKAVFGHVAIDSIAGPSEITVLADKTATPRFVAADLLSQAEHDVLASAILVTDSMELAEKVDVEVKAFTEKLSRKEIIEKSLDNYGYILVCEDMKTCIQTVNDIAPEHFAVSEEVLLIEVHPLHELVGQLLARELRRRALKLAVSVPRNAYRQRFPERPQRLDRALLPAELIAVFAEIQRDIKAEQAQSAPRICPARRDEPLLLKCAGEHSLLAVNPRDSPERVVERRMPRVVARHAADEHIAAHDVVPDLVHELPVEHGHAHYLRLMGCDEVARYPRAPHFGLFDDLRDLHDEPVSCPVHTRPRQSLDHHLH